MRNNFVIRISKIDSFYILLFVLIGCPGFYLGGELINVSDLLIPIFYFYYVLRYKITIPKRQLALFTYIVICLISIVLRGVIDKTFYFVAFIKWVRVFYYFLIYGIVIRMYDEICENKEGVIKCIMYSGLFSAGLAIILFLLQSPMYRAAQTMTIGGKMVFRAGGVFAEPNTLAFMMAIVLSVAVESLMQKNEKILSIITIALSGIVIVLSDTRIAIYAIVIAFLFSIDSTKKLFERKWKVIIALAILVLIAYASSTMVQRFVNERVLSILKTLLYGESIDKVSSGRIGIWNANLERFKNGGIMTMFFGRGYKIDGYVVDNNYLYALCNTGIIGLLVFLYFVIKNALSGILCWKIKDWYIRIFRRIFFVFILYMITNDAFTMNRCVSVIIIFLAMTDITLKKNRGLV